MLREVAREGASQRNGADQDERYLITSVAHHLGQHPPVSKFIQELDAQYSKDKSKSVWDQLSKLLRPNLPQVLAAGFRRVAVGSAIWNAAESGAEARRMIEVLNR